MILLIRELFNFINNRRLYIDERWFRIHCLYTSALLLFFFLVITTTQLAGEPMDCETSSDSVKESVLNTYCLIHHTYTVEEGFDNSYVGKDVVAPGVRAGTQFVLYRYYPWIWILYLFEMMCFYIPRWIWKGCESGTLRYLLLKSAEEKHVWKTHFNLAEEKKDSKEEKESKEEKKESKEDKKESTEDKKESTEEKESKEQRVVGYLYRQKEEFQRDLFAKRYFFCLCLALINVLFQMFLMNSLLNNEFYNYGINVFTTLILDPNSIALDRVFPKVTKCIFYKFGGSGSLQSFDALCVLPLNFYNRQFFTILWFWFSFVAILLMIAILVKLTLMVSSSFRSYYLKWKFNYIWDKNDPGFRKITFAHILLLSLIKQNTGIMFTAVVLEELKKRYDIDLKDKNDKDKGFEGKGSDGNGSEDDIAVNCFHCFNRKNIKRKDNHNRKVDHKVKDNEDFKLWVDMKKVSQESEDSDHPD